MQRAEELFQLLSSSDVVGQSGHITFSLGEVEVAVKDVSVVGNILQEWLSNFMEQKGFYFRKRLNTQEFPDFLLSVNDADTEDLLEVKVFTRSPNFDIANFRAYARSLRDHSYRLDANYLIFEYTLIGSHIKIENIWLKNVWEICGPSARSPVKIQWKQGDPVNIRPATWYSKTSKYKPFASRRNFVEALNHVIGMANVDASIQKKWLEIVEANYYKNTGENL